MTRGKSMPKMDTHLLLRIGSGALDEYTRAAEDVDEPRARFVRGAAALRAWQLDQGDECTDVRFMESGVERSRREAVKCARPVGHGGPHVSAGALGEVVTW